MANLSFKRYSTTAALNAAKPSLHVGDVVFDAQAKIIYIVTAVSGSSVTLEPYYGNKNIVSATSSGPTVTLTYADDSTSSFTIDNVSHATNDSAGNNIIETYAKTIDFQPIVNKLSEFESSIKDITTWIENPEANEITANVLNTSEYINLGGYLILPTDVANIQNLSTINTDVTSLQTDVTALKGYFTNGVANSAAKLSTTNVGSTSLPVYFSGGVPVACIASSVFSNLSNSNNNISITVAGQNRTLTVGYATNAGTAATCSGNAATATKLATSTTINGTNFDGSAAITTANWGTARNISISDATAANTGVAVSVNGSGDITLKLPDTIAATVTTSLNCSGNSVTATTSGLLDVKDVRGVTRKPSYFTNEKITAWFNQTGTPDSNWYSGIHIKGWHANYYSWELASGSTTTNEGDGLWYRRGVQDTWNGWRKILDSGNYYLYSPTRTGGGASGDWNINITGTAATATTASSCTGNAATANTLYTARTLWGQSFNGSENVDGTIRITSNAGSYCEGIRIKPYDGRTTILLGGTDLTANTGTSAASWSLHTYTGNFYLNRNACDAATTYILCNVSGNWGIATNAPSYKLHVNGTFGVNGTSTLAGDVTANSNVNVALQTTSTTFNVANGCEISYDNTNKCLKFTF